MGFLKRFWLHLRTETLAGRIRSRLTGRVAVHEMLDGASGIRHFSQFSGLYTIYNA